MKHLVLLTIITCFGITKINAQSDKGDFTLAPQIGINLATYYAGSSDVTFDNRNSFAGGLVGEYYFSDRWSLRSGLLYDPMGAIDGFDNVDKLNYLTIPLNANWHFGSNRNWYLNFGLGVAILLSAEGELSDGTTIELKDSIPGSDFGLMLGIGYKFNVSDNVQLYIDYQGYGGFSNLYEANNLPFDLRNSRSSFNLGCVFSL
jgi:opacity protein-like surface antigen